MPTPTYLYSQGHKKRDPDELMVVINRDPFLFQCSFNDPMNILFYDAFKIGRHLHIYIASTTLLFFSASTSALCILEISQIFLT